MKHFDEKQLTASFFYNGEKQYVTAGSHCLPAGLEVTLAHEKAAECADYLLFTMKNVGTENTCQIQSVKTLDLSVETKMKPVYHGLTGDDCGADSFLPIDKVIEESYHEEPQGGRSSNHTGFPYFDLTWDEGAAVFAIGWTGQWSKDILVQEDGFELQIGLCDSDFYLKPGEQVRLASVLIVTGENAKAARRSFRRILKEYYSPRTYLKEEMKVPVSIQCFDRYFQGIGQVGKDNFWATQEGQLRTIEAAARLKNIDTLWLDAAWFEKGFPNGVGNFCFSKGFPNGLKPVSDRAHKENMKFVLWFEPERVTRGTELYERPEFLLDAEYNNFKLYNLADEQARGWLKEKLISMIRDNGIDVYRQDFNMDPLPYWRAQDEEGRCGITEMHYISGLYELWDGLLAEFPKLLIDNCSSGGRRLDLETSRRSITLWKSDTGCFPETQKQRVTVWSQNQTLSLSEYLPYHACAVWQTDAYTVRSTATQGLACNFDIFNPEFDFEAAEKITAEVQEMRGYWEGDFYPMGKADTDESIWTGFQLALPDRGAFYVFRREESEISVWNITFDAVKQEKEYCLTFIDEQLKRTQKVYTGRQLLDGIPVEILQKRSSLIVLYEEKAEEKNK